MRHSRYSSYSACDACDACAAYTASKLYFVSTYYMQVQSMWYEQVYHEKSRFQSTTLKHMLLDR